MGSYPRSTASCGRDLGRFLHLSVSYLTPCNVILTRSLSQGWLRVTSLALVATQEILIVITVTLLKPPLCLRLIAFKNHSWIIKDHVKEITFFICVPGNIKGLQLVMPRNASHVSFSGQSS